MNVYGVLMCLLASAARALKSVLQEVLLTDGQAPLYFALFIRSVFPVPSLTCSSTLDGAASLEASRGRRQQALACSADCCSPFFYQNLSLNPNISLH